MSIKTYSGFTYGHTVTEDNKFIDFDEGIGEITAEIEEGSYTLNDYVNAVSNALNNAGTQEYTILLDANTRVMTISAPSNFDLLVTTGTNIEISAYPLMGFTADKLASNSHSGDEQSGSFYEPQNILQSFIPFEDSVLTPKSSKRVTAPGDPEVVSYGKVEFMECNIIPITDITPQLSIKSSATARADFRTFINYCIEQAPIEFVADIENPTFIPCQLESTLESRDGVGFKIKPFRKLFGYFQSGKLVFRRRN